MWATVTLEVSGLKSYHELLRFKDLLSAEVKGVKQVFQRSYRDGEAELILRSKVIRRVSLMISLP